MHLNAYIFMPIAWLFHQIKQFLVLSCMYEEQSVITRNHRGKILGGCKYTSVITTDLFLHFSNLLHSSSLVLFLGIFLLIHLQCECNGKSCHKASRKSGKSAAQSHNGREFLFLKEFSIQKFHQILLQFPVNITFDYVFTILFSVFRG